MQLVIIHMQVTKSERALQDTAGRQRGATEWRLLIIELIIDAPQRPLARLLYPVLQCWDP